MLIILNSEKFEILFLYTIFLKKKTEFVNLPSDRIKKCSHPTVNIYSSITHRQSLPRVPNWWKLVYRRVMTVSVKKVERDVRQVRKVTYDRLAENDILGVWKERLASKAR